jgi:hypothetical protein
MRHARLKRKPSPAFLRHGFVQDRHHAVIFRRFSDAPLSHTKEIAKQIKGTDSRDGKRLICRPSNRPLE